MLAVPPPTYHIIPRRSALRNGEHINNLKRVEIANTPPTAGARESPFHVVMAWNVIGVFLLIEARFRLVADRFVRRAAVDPTPRPASDWDFSPGRVHRKCAD